MVREKSFKKVNSPPINLRIQTMTHHKLSFFPLHWFWEQDLKCRQWPQIHTNWSYLWSYQCLFPSKLGQVPCLLSILPSQHSPNLQTANFCFLRCVRSAFQVLVRPLRPRSAPKLSHQESSAQSLGSPDGMRLVALKQCQKLAVLGQQLDSRNRHLWWALEARILPYIPLQLWVFLRRSTFSNLHSRYAHWSHQSSGTWRQHVPQRTFPNDRSTQFGRFS